MTLILKKNYDYVIIGSGFFGLSILKHLYSLNKNSNFLLIDKESKIMNRASRWNQARVHMGYHYPRSISTAIRSKENYSRFSSDWEFAIDSKNESLYMISDINSKTNSKNFERFMSTVELKYADTTEHFVKLLNAKNIEKIYKVQEDTFSSNAIKEYFENFLENSNIDYIFNTNPYSITNQDSKIEIQLSDRKIYTQYLFNCTYGGLGKYSEIFLEKNLLKYEIAEITFVKVPNILKNYNVTVMDGPFFSLMNFPDNDYHTLSHVRYTPHREFFSKEINDPYYELQNYEKQTNFPLMKLDSMKYIPSLEQMEHKGSYFEIKSVLNSSEVNDSREILVHREKNQFNILGSKLDQIYDLLDLLEKEIL